MPNTPDTISSTPDSAVVQFTPAYPTGIPAAQQLDTVVQRVESLPVMETPKVSAPTIHSRGPLYDTGSMSLLLMSMLNQLPANSCPQTIGGSDAQSDFEACSAHPYLHR